MGSINYTKKQKVYALHRLHGLTEEEAARKAGYDYTGADDGALELTEVMLEGDRDRSREQFKEAFREHREQ